LDRHGVQIEMLVLTIISRDLEKGSTKYRLVQYLEFLKKNGVDIDFIKRDAIDASTVRTVGRYDAVFNQKCLLRNSLARNLINNSRRTIFDFDDSIYTRPGKPYAFLTRFRVQKRLRLWLHRADLVTTSSRYLAGYARKYTRFVEIIPMALDLKEWGPRKRKKDDTIRIGWAGSPVNIPLIEKLDPVLISLMKRFPFVKMAIFSGQKPRLKTPFEHHPFHPGGEPEFIRALDIGLLPLNDDEHSRGKSPIKGIQYLACGIPVVGNIIGATSEIMNRENSLSVSSDEEWLQALETLITNRELAEKMGRAGRQFAESNHDAGPAGESLLNSLTG